MGSGRKRAEGGHGALTLGAGAAGARDSVNARFPGSIEHEALSDARLPKNVLGGHLQTNHWYVGGKGSRVKAYVG
jgi:hypothetical protein